MIKQDYAKFYNHFITFKIDGEFTLTDLKNLQKETDDQDFEVFNDVSIIVQVSELISEINVYQILHCFRFMSI